jgi:hypothetical protein
MSTRSDSPPNQPLAQALKLAADDLARQAPPPFARLWPAAAAMPSAAEPPVPTVRPAGARPSRAPGGSGWFGASLGPRRGGWAMAACAGLIVGSLLLTLQPWAPALRGAASGGPQVVVRDGWELLPEGFVPVAGAERWVASGQGVAKGWIVPAELPAERLASLGLPFDPGAAAARVPAELLMRADGEVLAVRVLH